MLTSPEILGQATLHRFPDSAILEGFWKEDGVSGLWRIHLPAAVAVERAVTTDAPPPPRSAAKRRQRPRRVAQAA